MSDDSDYKHPGSGRLLSASPIRVAGITEEELQRMEKQARRILDFTDVLKLIDEVRRLRAEVARMQRVTPYLMECARNGRRVRSCCAGCAPLLSARCLRRAERCLVS